MDFEWLATTLITDLSLQLLPLMYVYAIHDMLLCIKSYKHGSILVF